MFSTPTSKLVVILALAVQILAQQNSDDSVIKAEAGSIVEIPLNSTLSENEIFISLTWKHGANGDIAVLGGPVELYYDKYQGRAQVQKDSYFLTLANLTLSDSGEYLGTLVTSEGTKEERSVLEVLASPSVNAQSVPVTDDGSGSEEVLANCIALGGSSPFTIEWYDGDTIMAEDAGRTSKANGESESLLDAVLPLVSVPNAATDNGRPMTCVVTDALGRRIEREVFLQVTEPTTTVATTTMQAFPEITKFPRMANLPLVMGHKRVLTCQAVGVPEPEVIWFRDDVKIKSGAGENRIEVIADSYDRSGMYKCEAVNEEGRVMKELRVTVEGAPVIPDLDDLPNKTEEVILSSGQDYLQLTCQSNSNPRPKILWTVEGRNKSELDLKEPGLVLVDGGSTSNISINARHFLEAKTKTKVTCLATNKHGVARKEFVITAPIVSSNVGMVVGIIIALIIIIVIVVLVAYLALAKKRQGSMTTTDSAESGICGAWSACCGGAKTVKSKELKEEEDVVAVEHVKEVNEEGTSEEKQKLTEAEETPAKEEEKKEEVKEGEEDEEKKEGEEAKPKKTKAKISLPMQCCKGKKEKEPENPSQEEHVVDEEGQDKDAGNGDTQKDEKAEERGEKDRDSGKGDTLEKVIEEEEK